VEPWSNSVDIRHLRYFLAVAEEGSFTRAAALLHVAQPPLSAQIRQLERRVGADLFAREPGHVRLTDAGRALLDFAYVTVGALQRGLAAAHAVGSSEPTTLKVVATPTVNVAPLLRVFDRLRRGNPEIRLDLARSDRIEHRVSTGQADAALVRPPILDPTLWHGLVSTEAVFAVVAGDHSLAHLVRPAVPDLLAHDTVELAEAKTGIGRPCGSVDALLADVVSGRYVGILPEHLVPGPDSGLTLLRICGLDRVRTLVVRRSVGNIDAVITLTNLLTATTSRTAQVAAVPS